MKNALRQFLTSDLFSNLIPRQRIRHARKMRHRLLSPRAIAITFIALTTPLGLGQTGVSHTVPPVALTLDPNEKIVQGTSLLWSPSGQAAWDAMRKYHGVKKLELTPHPQIATVLNNFQWDAASVLPAHTFIYGGDDSEARREEIRQKLRHVAGAQAAAMIGPYLPPGPVGPLLDRIKSALFVSCISHAPKFPSSFIGDTEKQFFTSSQGTKLLTWGFGVDGAQAAMMGSAFVVQADDLEGSFVLRLPFMKTDRELPDALILAQKPGMKSLAEGIEWMRQSLKKPVDEIRVVEHQGKHWSYISELTSEDRFWMPKLKATVACDYGDLIEKTYLHDPNTLTFWKIREAQQMLNFRLDETGAMTQAVFKVTADFLSLGGAGSGGLPAGMKMEDLPVWPKKFILNGPFLAALWRKDAEWPYLVCWVDSGEVMATK